MPKSRFSTIALVGELIACLDAVELDRLSAGDLMGWTAPLGCGLHRRRLYGTSMPETGAVHPIRSFTQNPERNLLLCGKGLRPAFSRRLGIASPWPGDLRCRTCGP